MRKTLRYLLYLLGLYILIHVAMYGLQEQFFFLEEKLHADHTFNFKNFEELNLEMQNGDKVNGLYFKTQDAVKGTILYFHGNAGNLDRWGGFADRFTTQGYNILMIDYRGYGKSEGEPSETNFYEDGQKAYDWILEKTSADNLVIYGRSIGCGVATKVAADNSAKLLVMETPFNNLQDVAQTKYPFLFLKYPLRHLFPNDKHLPKVNCPIHIFHGTADGVVPYECASKLKDHLKPGDQFYTIENGGHNDLINFPQFKATLNKILE